MGIMGANAALAQELPADGGVPATDDAGPAVEGEPTGTAGEETDAEAPLTEEERSERARALFGEGVGHSQAEAWSDAAASFEAALELRAAPAIRYNLAAAYVELGRYRDAGAQLDQVEADPETPPNIATLSTALAERIRREAGRLSVERPAELEDAAVTLDEEPLDAMWLDREIPVAPGAHVVTAARGGREVARTEVSVAAGEHTHVVLGLAGAIGDPNGSSTPTPIYEEWGFWAAVGGGALVLTIVIAAVAAAASGGDAPPVVGNFMPGVITW